MIEWRENWPGAWVAWCDALPGSANMNRCGRDEPEEWHVVWQSRTIGRYPSEEDARDAVEAVFISDLDAKPIDQVTAGK